MLRFSLNFVISDVSPVNNKTTNPCAHIPHRARTFILKGGFLWVSLEISTLKKKLPVYLSYVIFYCLSVGDTLPSPILIDTIVLLNKDLKNFCVKKFGVEEAAIDISSETERSRHLNNSSNKMVDVFLICVIVIGFFLLAVIGLYLVVKYQHPDDKNDAYIPKLVVLLGFVLAGGTVFLLPLDVANNSNFAGECI